MSEMSSTASERRLSEAKQNGIGPGKYSTHLVVNPWLKQTKQYLSCARLNCGLPVLPVIRWGVSIARGEIQDCGFIFEWGFNGNHILELEEDACDFEGGELLLLLLLALPPEWLAPFAIQS
jgi:hypothetical protein